MTNDDTDPEKIDELEEQLSKQQAVIDSMASQMEAVADVLPDSTRRRVLTAGGAAALFGAGAVGGAAATPGDDGDTVWGSDSNRDDYYADEVDANLINTGKADITDVFETVADDAALDALSLSAGDTLMLASTNFSTDRTFSARLRLIGAGGLAFDGTVVSGTWTISARATISDITNGGTISLDATRCKMRGIDHGAGASITVNADNCVLTEFTGGDVTFSSGTSGGVIDSSAGTTVTDNGTNTVGDIA